MLDSFHDAVLRSSSDAEAIGDAVEHLMVQ